jgi:hypothetical protein
MAKKPWLLSTFFVFMFAGPPNVAAESSLYKKVLYCGSVNLECFAWAILPNNSSGINQRDTTVREWAASEGHIYGKDDTIVMRLHFDKESLQTLGDTTLLQPFALEIDISEANNGARLEFEYVDHTFPEEALAVQDIDASNEINDNKNAIGLLVRNARAINDKQDYYVIFHLKHSIPAEGVAVVPSLQIAYNTHYLQLAGFAIKDLELIMNLKSPWNFFPLEAEIYADVSDKDRISWMVYPASATGNPNFLPGMSWRGKYSGGAKKDFIVVLHNGHSMDTRQIAQLSRFDYLDRVCREVSPNPIVEQFRNLLTSRITIYRTPDNQTGYRYANADCGVEGFALPAADDGDGSGSGDAGGSGQSGKPNLRAIDTFVTYGESASSQRVERSDKVFLGTPLWCQMKMDNNGSKDADDTFYSACYVSRGLKFDGWGDAVSLGKARTGGLDRGESHTEHKGIDILSYPGWYNVVSRIDVDNDVDELDEKDNVFNKDDPFAFQVWGRPNVTVSVAADKASYVLGESVSATAYFANTGGHPFGKTGYVDWYVDGAIVDADRDRILRENLGPGVSGKSESAVLALPQHYGTHEIKACFRYNKDDLVEDAEPADNCAVVEISVPDPNPPVAVRAFPPDFPTDGGGSTDNGGGGTGTVPAALPTVCGTGADISASGLAGSVRIWNERHQLTFNDSIGQVGFWTPVSGLDLASADVCFNSDETGWEGSSVACATPVSASGTWSVDIPSTTPEADGTWTFAQAGKTHWVNPAAFGLPTVNGHVQYGGWRRSQAWVEPDASGKLALAVTFGYGGFWYPAGSDWHNRTVQAYWWAGQGTYPGISGTVACDGMTGQFTARFEGIELGQIGNVLLRLDNNPTDFAWNLPSQWTLLPGVAFVEETGGQRMRLDGVTPTSAPQEATPAASQDSTVQENAGSDDEATPQQKFPTVEYDNRAGTLTLTLPSGSEAAVFPKWKNPSKGKPVFLVWKGPGKKARKIPGTASVSDSGRELRFVVPPGARGSIGIRYRGKILLADTDVLATSSGIVKTVHAKNGRTGIALP